MLGPASIVSGLFCFFIMGKVASDIPPDRCFRDPVEQDSAVDKASWAVFPHVVMPALFAFSACWLMVWFVTMIHKTSVSDSEIASCSHYTYVCTFV